MVNHSQFFGAAIGIAIGLLAMTASEFRSAKQVPPGVTLVLGVLAALLVALGSTVALLYGSEATWLRDSVLGTIMVGVLAQGVRLLGVSVRDRAWHPEAHPVWATLLVVLAVTVGVVAWRWLPSSKQARFLAQYPRHLEHVEGTCLNEACGLRQHVQARENSARKGKLINDGEPLEVICQRFGGRVVARSGRRSELWDLLPNRLWVSDLFVSTSKHGLRSSELPPCPAVPA